MNTIKLKSVVPVAVKLIFKDGIIREVSPGQIIEVDESNRGLHDGKYGPLVEIEQQPKKEEQEEIRVVEKTVVTKDTEDVEPESYEQTEQEIESDFETPEDDYKTDGLEDLIASVEKEIEEETEQNVAPIIEMPRKKAGRPPKNKK